MIDPFPLLRPLLHSLDAERAHGLTLTALEAGLLPRYPVPVDPLLTTRLFGHSLPNPLGLAAGFDKNARVFHRMDRIGFGFVEVGGVTPLPQTGNPRPRLFRLAEDEAVINRMGFNNEGMEAVAARLAARRPSGPARRMLGVNLASNTDSRDPAGDFLLLARRFAPLADFLTLDISCPNTANGKLFLNPEPLDDLLTRIAAVFREPGGPRRPALVAKIAPDLNEGELAAILTVLHRHAVDGLILTNTSIDRPAGLLSPYRDQRGGLSGAPLFARSTALLREVAAESKGRLTLIGTGGIRTGADAYAKIRAGASAVQLYTAMVYRGPAVVGTILTELAALLRRDGFTTLSEAVGADLK